MHCPDVALASIGVTIPKAQWTSEQIEKDLHPLYSRLKLPEGRLAMMSGIDSRRVWEPGTVPSGPSIESGRNALEAASVAQTKSGL